MRIFTLLAAASVLVTLSSAAAAQNQPETCADRFFSDRPGATNGHWTVGQGCALLEASAIQVDRAPAATSLSFPMLLRIGVVPGFELRVASSIVGVDIPDEGTTEASAPGAALEAKLMAVQSEGGVPGLGLLFGAGSVTNSDFGRELSVYSSLLFDWQLAQGFSLSINAGPAMVPLDDPEVERGIGLRQAAVLWLDIPTQEWMSIFADGAGGIVFREGQDFEQTVGGGLAFRPGPDQLQLDSSAWVLATGDEHPVTVNLGLTVGF